MRLLTTTFILLLSLTFVNAQIPTPEEQIAAAVLTAPEELQKEAGVLGFDSEGKIIMLRVGNNQLICLADDPNKPGYNAACYHKDLEPFMARGRALRAEGKKRNEVFDIREQEAKSGQLNMPKEARTLHIRYGKGGKYNKETGKIDSTNLRYVVYIPWATAESSGLPVKPIVPGGPWIMFPGTHSAHIMITPPNK